MSWAWADDCPDPPQDDSGRIDPATAQAVRDEENAEFDRRMEDAGHYHAAQAEHARQEAAEFDTWAGWDGDYASWVAAGREDGD